MVRISKIIARVDESMEILKCLRRDLLVSQHNAEVLENMKQEHQANQHGDNPMGKDGDAR